MTKKEYIGAYLDGRMKGHGLPLSMAYYSLLEKRTTEAEEAWNKFFSKKKPKTK